MTRACELIVQFVLYFMCLSLVCILMRSFYKLTRKWREFTRERCGFSTHTVGSSYIFSDYSKRITAPISPGDKAIRACCWPLTLKRQPLSSIPIRLCGFLRSDFYPNVFFPVSSPVMRALLLLQGHWCSLQYRTIHWSFLTGNFPCRHCALGHATTHICYCLQLRLQFVK